MKSVLLMLKMKELLDFVADSSNIIVYNKDGSENEYLSYIAIHEWIDEAERKLEACRTYMIEHMYAIACEIGVQAYIDIEHGMKKTKAYLQKGKDEFR